jgi:hypothetical protein
MKWTIVQCETCGKPYAARRVEGGFHLPTRSGGCTCGGDAFVEVE